MGAKSSLVPRARIGLDSRLAVARLGLATVSRSRLLARQRSDVRFSVKINKLILTFWCRGRESNFRLRQGFDGHESILTFFLAI